MTEAAASGTSVASGTPGDPEPAAGTASRATSVAPRDRGTTVVAERVMRKIATHACGNGAGSEGEGYVRMSLTLLGDKAGERYAEAAKRIKESGLVTKAHV